MLFKKFFIPLVFILTTQCAHTSRDPLTLQLIKVISVFEDDDKGELIIKGELHNPKAPVNFQIERSRHSCWITMTQNDRQQVIHEDPNMPNIDPTKFIVTADESKIRSFMFTIIATPKT